MQTFTAARAVLDAPVVQTRKNGLLSRLLARLTSRRARRSPAQELPLCERCLEPLRTEEEQAAGHCSDTVTCSLTVRSDRSW